jgi:hypothetical protein
MALDSRNVGRRQMDSTKTKLGILGSYDPRPTAPGFEKMALGLGKSAKFAQFSRPFRRYSSGFSVSLSAMA